MTNRSLLTDDEGEVRELTTEDFKRFRTVGDVLPSSLLDKIGMLDRSNLSGTELISVQLSHDVLQSFRATGEGWQTRIDAALRDWLTTHSPE